MGVLPESECLGKRGAAHGETLAFVRPAKVTSVTQRQGTILRYTQNPSSTICYIYIYVYIYINIPLGRSVSYLIYMYIYFYMYICIWIDWCPDKEEEQVRTWAHW